ATQLFKGEPSRFAEEVDGFSVAALYPWFNVRRHDFYSLKYTEGASEELAGRGLYGDYVLLFPKQVLEKGFPLENVEDVLLRIDYLSVDDLASVNMFAGQITYSIPIDLPRGRAGFGPGLALSYSGDLGNGPLGVGWTLGSIAIRRSLREGVPRYDDSDELELIGVGEGGRL